jgi:hypothetical protein
MTLWAAIKDKEKTPFLEENGVFALENQIWGA